MFPGGGGRVPKQEEQDPPDVPVTCVEGIPLGYFSFSDDLPTRLLQQQINRHLPIAAVSGIVKVEEGSIGGIPLIESRPVQMESNVAVQPVIPFWQRTDLGYRVSNGVEYVEERVSLEEEDVKPPVYPPHLAASQGMIVSYYGAGPLPLTIPKLEIQPLDMSYVGPPPVQPASIASGEEMVLQDVKIEPESDDENRLSNDWAFQNWRERVKGAQRRAGSTYATALGDSGVVSSPFHGDPRLTAPPKMVTVQGGHGLSSPSPPPYSAYNRDERMPAPGFGGAQVNAPVAAPSVSAVPPEHSRGIQMPDPLPLFYSPGPDIPAGGMPEGGKLQLSLAVNNEDKSHDIDANTRTTQDKHKKRQKMVFMTALYPSPSVVEAPVEVTPRLCLPAATPRSQADTLVPAPSTGPAGEGRSGGPENQLPLVQQRPPRRAVMSVVNYAIQCLLCSKWRWVPNRKVYQFLREMTRLVPFKCEYAAHWRPGFSCQHPAEVTAGDPGHVWAIDVPNIPRPPPGWRRSVVLRGENTNCFSDVYYYAPDGSKHRSKNDILKFMASFPIYSNVAMSSFNYTRPFSYERSTVKRKRDACLATSAATGGTE